MNISVLFMKMISCFIGMFLLLPPLTVLAQTKVVVIPLFGDDPKPLKNIITVAKANGNFANPVTAVNSITDASATNPYLVVIGPGIYDLGATPLAMKSYVDIEGCGEGTTRITGTGNASDLIGTVVGSNDAELRYLTVENTGGAKYATAVSHNGDGVFRMTHVTAVAKGATNTNCGVYMSGSSHATVRNVTVVVTGDAQTTTMGFTGTTFFGLIEDLQIDVSGGQNNYGIRMASANAPLRRVSARAQGSASSNSATGLSNLQSSLVVEQCRFEALGALINFGVSMGGGWSGSYIMTISNCTLVGSTNTVDVQSDGGGASTVDIANSLLSGGAVSAFGAATIKCAGVVDEAYVFYASTCP